MTLVPVRGVDADNYDGPIPVAHYQKLHDLYGVRFQILGLEAYQPYAAIQRDNGQAGDVPTQFGYKFLYWQDNDFERMKQAAGFGLPVAIDVEYGDGMPGGPMATVERILQAKDVLIAEGLYWGQYSSVYKWGRLTHGTMALAGDNGWSANYPFNRISGPSVLPPVDYLPDLTTWPAFGGTIVKVAQYADVCYEDGPWHLDLNCMLMEDNVPPPITQPTLLEALEALVKAGAIMSAGNQNLADLDEVSKNAIRWVAEQVGGN